MSHFVKGFAVFIFLSAVGCAQQGPQQEQRASFVEVKARLESYLSQCTQTFGLDPRKESGLSENELAPNERDWLDCAYKGIERIMIPNSDFPGMYRDFIAEAKSLVDLMERGEVTRTQRRNRLQTLIAQIENAEIVRMIRDEPHVPEEKHRKNTELVRGMVEGFRGM